MASIYPMKLEFDNVNCNLCGSFDSEPFLLREDLNTFIEGKFQLVRCLHCGLVYENPRPSLRSWELIYPNQYDQYTQQSNEEFQKNFWYRFGFQKRLKAIERFKNGGTLCDLGCATGDFLREVEFHNNWKGYGVEPNEFASNLARKAGLNVETGTFGDNPFPGLNFDVISMWNVIEHLPNPTETLLEVNKRLNPGGILVFTTPNLESFDARFFGRFWIGYELPRHFYVFSKTTLLQYLQKTNFTYIEDHCIYGEHAAAMSSIRFWIKAKHPEYNKGLERVLFSLPLRILLSPIFYITDKMKKSSPITIIAQKR